MHNFAACRRSEQPILLAKGTMIPGTDHTYAPQPTLKLVKVELMSPIC